MDRSPWNEEEAKSAPFENRKGLRHPLSMERVKGLPPALLPKW